MSGAPRGLYVSIDMGGGSIAVGGCGLFGGWEHRGAQGCPHE
jgi:hypothetical protein